MYTIPLTARSQSTQPVSNTSPNTSRTETQDLSGFESTLNGLLKPDAENNVNEEELFAALLVERVQTLKGQAAASKFKDILEQTRAANSGKNGYIFHEKAGREALKAYLASGEISTQEADQIHSYAFNAAQLDNNKLALYDGKGGANDPTRAVASITAAVLSAKTLLEKYNSGAETPSSMGLAREYFAMGITPSSRGTLSRLTGTGPKNYDVVKPRSNKVDGADGFLWKPVSHTLNRAIVMMPPDYAGRIENVVLKDENGKVIDRAKHFSGGSAEFPREKWLFSKKGKQYPDNLSLEITFDNGKTKSYVLPDPGQRYD